MLIIKVGHGHHGYVQSISNVGQSCVH